MKAEWWIEGPPERFERGMLVRLYWDWELVVILVQEDGAWVHPDEDHDVTFITLVDVTAHCPMMPRKEAEEMAIALVEDVAGDYDVCVYTVEKHPDRVRQDWRRRLAEWREGRAGDE